LDGAKVKLQRQYRLAKREDFSKVYRVGKSVANRQFVVYAMTNRKTADFRVGISASKKLGNAVVRNRLRRLVKEIIRHEAERIAPGFDLIVIVRKPAVGLAYKEMEKSLLHVLKRASLLVQ